MKNAIKIGVGIIVLLLIIAAVYIVLNAQQNPNPNNDDSQSPIIPNPFINSPNYTSADDSGVTQESLQILSNGTTAFGFNMFQQLNSTNSTENIFFSPFSLSIALELLNEGADGKTSEQIREMLGNSNDINATRGAYASIINNLQKADANYIFTSANAFWVKKDFQILESYNKNLQTYYLSEAKNADFAGNPKAASDEINKWALDHTNGKISDIVSPEIVQPLVMLLANAVYFKGTWEYEFSKDLTKDYAFNSFGNQINVKMMAQEEAERFNYYDDNDLSAIELSYKGKDISMVIILPKNNSSQGLAAVMTKEKYETVLSEMTSEKVIVSVPKFKFETDYALKDSLSALGMQDAFISNIADLSKIDGKRDLFVDFVKQKAFVEVNEEGTEAAAVTVIGIGTTSAMPREPEVFVADHPFFFVIKDNTTGTILFMGKVIEPK